MQPEIQAGMRVSIFVPQTVEDDIQRTLSLSSIVEENLDDDYMLIHAPTYRGYNFPLPNEPLLMRFFFDSMPYSLQVLYEGHLVREKIMLAKMKRLTPVERHQMRENFRLSCHLPITIERGTGKDTDTSVFTGTALDLSESGMLVLTDAAIEQNEKINIIVDIGGEEKIKGSVLRVEEIQDGKYRYRAALRFKIEQRTQSDRIYKYIVSEQLALRRKSRDD